MGKVNLKSRLSKSELNFVLAHLQYLNYTLFSPLNLAFYLV